MPVRGSSRLLRGTFVSSIVDVPPPPSSFKYLGSKADHAMEGTKSSWQYYMRWSLCLVYFQRFAVHPRGSLLARDNQ